MSRPDSASIPGVDTRGVDRGGRLVKAMIVNCHACGATHNIYPPNANFPAAKVSKIMIARGWTMDIKRGRHVCADCCKKETAMPEKPREMQPADRRKIFRKLDEVYDDANGRYCDGWTDNAVAKDLAVPRKWVEVIREEAFGPAGRNVEMDRIAAEIGQLRAAAKAAEDAAMKAAADAERLVSQADDLRKRLEGLEAAVGPRAIALAS